MTETPSDLESRSAIVRATRSTPPPGCTGAMMRIGFEGQPAGICAPAANAVARQATASAAIARRLPRVGMMLLRFVGPAAALAHGLRRRVRLCRAGPRRVTGIADT